MVSNEPPLRPARPVDAMPLRIGSPEQFTRVRDFLRAIEFDEPRVAAALKIPDIRWIRNADFKDMDRTAVPPVLVSAIDLLVGGLTVAEDRFRAGCDETTFAAFTALDLVRPAHHQTDALVSPVWLYPIDGFVIASDRQVNPEGGAAPPTTEVVFPAHDSGTVHLLRVLPAAAGGDALDLCGGSGIAAIHLARDGMRAATTDITARSAHFAAFNARLNGFEVESLCGDLYGPVAGRRFDIVCAHPPWVPSTGDAMVFRDGGDTGEAIVARVVAGIPHHLRAGGTAILVSLGRDGRDASFQQRVRTWLGDAGRDCDVILGVEKILSIDDMIDSMRRLHLANDAEKAEQLAARFRELDTEKFVYGATFVRRTAAPVMEPPLRLRMSVDATASDFERIFAWRAFRRTPGAAQWLADARPRLSPHLELNIRHVVQGGAMTADSAILTAKRALSAMVQPDVWVARTVTQIDGRQTVAEVFETARQAGHVPENFTLAVFVDFVGQMIERGLLDIDVPAGHRA